MDVRVALRSYLLAQHADDIDQTRFVDELDVCGTVRADVAVLNGSFTGYELKSARDTLQRLPKQVEYYSRVFDYAVLVVAENHLDDARKIVPDWWGVTLAIEGEDGRVVLDPLVESRMNPLVDPASLVTLLWREETLEILTSLGLDRGVRSKPKLAMWQRLVASVSPDVLREIVRNQIKGRKGWRPDPMRLLDDGMCPIVAK